MRCPYTVLGVKKNAGPNEIKSAYRKLAKTWHPDQNRSDPKAGDRFSEVAHAYRLLIDPELRLKFDEGHIDARGRRKPKPARGFTGNPFSAFRDSWRGKAEAKAETKADAKAAPDDAYGGAQAEKETDEASFEAMVNHIFGESAQRRKVTDAPGMSDGAGTGEGSGNRDGRGQATGKDGDPLAALDDLFVKWKARRRNRFRRAEDRHLLEIDLEDAMRGCQSEITLASGLTVSVPVPAGTPDGAAIRLRPDSDDPEFDIMVTVKYRPHPDIRIFGHDLHGDHAVELDEAILGANMVFQAPDGPVRFTVPEWANAKKSIVVPGRGLRRTDNTRGDLHIHLRIQLPGKADEHLVDLMRSRRRAWYV